jgi:hypothetical protein
MTQSPQSRNRQPKINDAIFLEPRKTDSLFADTTLPAFLRAVLAILAILAGMAGVGTGAGRCGSARWYLAEEKNPQHDVSQNNGES